MTFLGWQYNPYPNIGECQDFASIGFNLFDYVDKLKQAELGVPHSKFKMSWPNQGLVRLGFID